MLRIVFSRLGEPSAGPSFRYSFNLPAGACPCCEGMSSVTDIDLTQLFDDSKSLAEGAITIPGYKADGWMVRIFTESGFLDPDKPIRNYTEAELHDFLHREPTKVKVNGVNLTYEGLIPRVQKSFLSKDREAMQPHIRAFVDRAVTFTACSECGGTRLNEAARSSRIGGAFLFFLIHERRGREILRTSP
jgi:excinuclease UvrABC ATPase subunit